ncbi:MAG TPA: hypothetical protein VF510_14040 [Ktedonobacterales bacterium]
MKRFLSFHWPVRLALLGALVALVALLLGGVVLPATVLAAPRICDVHCVITYGDTRITERQAALAKLGSAISDRAKDKHITSDQANSLQSDVATNQTGLAALKTKLDAETQASAARQDVKNIYEQFRIYAVVLPRDYRTLELDIEINVGHTLKDLEPKLQTAIDSAPSGIKDQLTSLYNDYVLQVANAEGQIDAAQGQLPELTPTNFNTNQTGYKTALTNLRNDVHTASKDLHQAGKDLHQMRELLKGAGGTAPTATP